MKYSEICSCVLQKYKIYIFIYHFISVELLATLAEIPIFAHCSSSPPPPSPSQIDLPSQAAAKIKKTSMRRQPPLIKKIIADSHNPSKHSILNLQLYKSKKVNAESF